MVDDLLEATRRVNDGDRISVSYLSVMDVRLYIPRLRPHRIISSHTHQRGFRPASVCPLSHCVFLCQVLWPLPLL